MAARDVKLYLSLKKALIDKVANPNLASHTLEVDGALRSYDYDYIFQTARRVFPQKYNLGHSYLEQVPISNLQSSDLKKLNLEYAEDIVKAWGGVDQSQVKEKELDAQLIEYEKELTAPDEPDYLYKELDQHAESEEIQESFEEPTEANPVDQVDPSTISGSSQRPSRVNRPLTNKEQFGTKEAYGEYKEINKDSRNEQAKKLWENRRKDSFNKEQYGQYKEENKDDRKKRAEELWKNRKASLLKPNGTQGGWNPLGDWLGKKAAEKIAQSRIGQAVAKNFIDPVKQALQSSKAWQSVAPRLQPIANAFDKIASPFRAISNAIGAPERWLNNNILNPLQNWAGSAARSMLNNGFALAKSGINNLVNALRGYGSQAAAGASALGAGIMYAGTTLAAIVTSAAFWWVLAIAGFFIFTWWYNQQLSNVNCDKPGELRLEKRLVSPASGDNQIRNGERIDYLIQVTYVWLCDEKTLPSVTITDPVPAELDYVDESAQSESSSQSPGPDGFYNPDSRNITWELTNVRSNDPIGLYFSVRPRQNDDGSWTIQDTWLQNQATATYRDVQATTSGGAGVINLQSATLEGVINQAAQSVGMEPALMKAFLRVEAPGALNYSEEEFRFFSTPGWWEGLQGDASTLKGNDAIIIRGYAYNTCAYRSCAPGADVRGVTQFEAKTWAGIAAQLTFSDGHTPDRRNATDAIFGSALLNKQNAQYYTGSPNFEWTEDVIRAAGRIYCGGPGAARRKLTDGACMAGGRQYEDLLWDFYQEYRGQ